MFGLILIFIPTIIWVEATTTTTTTTMMTTTTVDTSYSYICVCDNTSQVVAGTGCSITGSDTEVNYAGCSCADGTDIQPKQVSGIWVLYCGDEPTGNYTGYTTTTTTTVSTSTDCEDLDEDGECDEAQALRCTTRYMSESLYKIFKWAFLVMFIWITGWVLATIFVNIKHKNTGHHRYIHLFEEISIVLLFLTMVGLQLFFNIKQNPCKLLKILSHLFMVVTCGAFFFEAWFANSLINANSLKNGSVPAFLNYLLPVVMGVVVSLLSYFAKKTEYALSGLHCLAPTNAEILWAYCIPPWILLMAASWKVQTAFLQCRKFDPKKADEKQIYWAFRSARALPPFGWLLFGIYMSMIFGMDQQLFWVLALAIVMMIIYGPAIFFVHTYGHINVSL
ncbi:unnamed protein product, partial [Mesorhabditis spiculigera]